MAAHRLGRAENSLRFKLFFKQPWLQEKDREKALEELLDLCLDLDEQNLICTLLHRFYFVDDSQLRVHFREMVQHITSEWGLSQDRTQIVATAFDACADSSQLIIQSLKPELVDAGWDKAVTVNNIGKSVRKLSTYPNVVLVDEFIGTGDTMTKRIRDIQNAYANEVNEGRARLGYKIHVCVLASMEQGLKKVQKTEVDIHANVVLKKGMSGYLVGAALRDACKQMLRIESELSQTLHAAPLPSFGYGKSQSLFGTEGNVPNNVFPVFWWPRLRDNRARRTLLRRLET